LRKLGIKVLDLRRIIRLSQLTSPTEKSLSLSLALGAAVPMLSLAPMSA